MVSKDNVIETNTKCICGNGDELNFKTSYFENKCPNCNAEGQLQVETENNVEVNNNSFDEDSQETSVDTSNQEAPSLKVVCKSCGSEFCGQDGYDLLGGTRASLTYVNPSDITNDDEDDEASSTDENETTYMSGWEGLCDLLKPLDGQAMMVQRGDYVVIKRIEMPKTARLWAYEGINVVDDSVSVTDYTPEIYNTFVIRWGEKFENELEFTFNKHKQLFGERKIVIEAKKYSVVDEESEEKSDENSGGGIFDSIFGSNSSEEDLKNTDTTGDLAYKDDTDDSSNEDAPETEEVPITDREEAIRFGLTQVGKAKREDGHTIELKVIGNSRWQMGEWCHVKLPSFNEDSYMFISKCSFESSPDSEYINSLTLVDYPPSLGKPKKVENNDDNKDDSSTDTDVSANSNDANANDDSSNTDNSGNDNESSNK